jgi:branched-chain amino acid transport system permease protein
VSHEPEPAPAGAPAPGTPAPGPQVGADEWVARQAQRREYLPGWRGDAQRLGDRAGWWPRLGAAAAVAALLPLFGLGGFQLQVGINALLLALLAVGLNVTVGWAGLLDLGYVAFFGFGAYGFALLSSGQIGSSGIHLPAYLSLPAVIIGAAILGLLVGLPSRRLIGDYLAIVTLFFGEAFVEFTNNVAPHTLGGPNGIVGIDPIRIGIRFIGTEGYQLTTNRDYYYLLLVLLVLTMAALHLLDRSRTGRAWRAVRDDPLAAASMTIPVNRVKLMAFALGAMIAALAGSIFAAQQISVFPPDFNTAYLILIYAGLILGGAGSIAGAVAGGLTVVVILDGLLRSPTDAGYIFYGLILVSLVVKVRPWRKLGALLAATIALGFAAHAVAGAISASAVAGGPQSGGWIGGALRDWIIVPASPQTPGNIGFVLLVCLLIALVQLRGRWRTALLVPTIYLAACVWEARLAAEPSITRQILIGAILVVMMNSRPQGLLGARRVEVIT